jgi:hypothetical protein
MSVWSERSIPGSRFSALAPEEKAPHLGAGGAVPHAARPAVRREQLDAAGALATQIRFIAKTARAWTSCKDLLRTSGPCSTSRSPARARSSPSARPARSSASDRRGARHLDLQRVQGRVAGGFRAHLQLVFRPDHHAHAERGLAERMAWVLSNSERRCRSSMPARQGPASDPGAAGHLHAAAQLRTAGRHRRQDRHVCRRPGCAGAPCARCPCC